MMPLPCGKCAVCEVDERRDDKIVLVTKPSVRGEGVQQVTKYRWQTGSCQNGRGIGKVSSWLDVPI